MQAFRRLNAKVQETTYITVWNIFQNKLNIKDIQYGDNVLGFLLSKSQVHPNRG